MNVQEKRRLRKIAIMEAALDVWSDDEFCNTSLATLSKHLGMTKPALYRYFKNKEDLLDSMAGYVQELETAWIGTLIEKLNSISEERRLHCFIEWFAMGLKKGYRYAQFDSFNTLRCNTMTRKQRFAQAEGLKEAVGTSLDTLNLVMMYCFFFWGWHEMLHIQQERSDREKIDLVLDLVQHGLGTGNFMVPSAQKDHEVQAQVDRLKRTIQEEPVIMAVTGVVQEKGFSGITLEKIAESAGMSKSTLYNYFENKDQMLTKSLNTIVKQYIELHRALLSEKDSFEEKLLTHLELQSSFFPKKPQAFIVMKQFVGKGVISKLDRPVYQPGFLTFMDEGIKADKLKPCFSAIEYQVIFSFFIFLERVIFESGEYGSQARELPDWLELLTHGTQESERKETSRSK